MARLGMMMFVAGATAQSLTNCAGAAAHFQNMAVSISPDPPVRGENVTIQFTGTFDKEVQHGVMVASVKAGPINLKAVNLPFHFTPAVGAAGQLFTGTVGPFQYPSVRVPLFSSFSGKIEVTQDDGEEWLCIAYNLPSYYDPEPEPKLQDGPFADCTDPTKAVHVHNFEITTDPVAPQKGDDMNVTLKGDLDEDVDTLNMDFSMDLSIVKVNLHLPISFSPALPATTGVQADIGPVNLVSIPLIPNAKGSAVLTDKNGEQLSCINYNIPVMGETESVEV